MEFAIVLIYYVSTRFLMSVGLGIVFGKEGAFDPDEFLSLVIMLFMPFLGDLLALGTAGYMAGVLIQEWFTKTKPAVKDAQLKADDFID